MNKPIAVFSNLDMLERMAATFALAARGRYHPRLPVSEPGYLIAMSRPLILASTSRYRKALLRQAKREGAANHPPADDDDICCMNCHGYYP